MAFDNREQHEPLSESDLTRLADDLFQALDAEEMDC